MTYLSKRTVKSFTPSSKVSADDYLLVQPCDRSIVLPNWEWIGWLQNNAMLVERRGEYELYRLNEGACFPTGDCH
ncbi:hypothetical protein Cpar_1461 [Chlorobaculum parvum NCIB 8327]|uniref:Uncharacterized protein n=1 Tax=Chlorobaculum parvum (strain DSM 263 / NCIMB 8327) TaxID=517417 RepID=B3QPK6_CHLP8|nr:hypothetical protein [Chlorobaculum parvum]ACF11859.1 hypothetical protein Cpar_1461 [Chlorobaculum parvum NCIB 8327]